MKNYIEDLAARKPAPGGGSAAALSGALGTALLEMVCNFTYGNEKYKAFEKDMEYFLPILIDIRKSFSTLIDEDVKAYSLISGAFKSKDKKLIEDSLKQGYYISLKICREAKNGLEIASKLPGKSNPNLITDIGCGAELLNAAFNSGIFNAKINLKGITDTAFTKKETCSLDEFETLKEELYKTSITATQKRMA